MWKARIFTLYPEIFPGPLASGLYKKALEKKLWSLEVINIRDYSRLVEKFQKGSAFNCLVVRHIDVMKEMYNPDFAEYKYSNFAERVYKKWW